MVHFGSKVGRLPGAVPMKYNPLCMNVRTYERIWFALCVHLFGLVPGFGQVYPDVAILKPAGILEVPSSDAFLRILQISSSVDGSLYFLCRHRFDAEIIRIDVSGKLLNKMTVPWATSQFAVDRNRAVIAYVKDRNAHRLLRIAESGLSVQDQPVTCNVGGMALLGDDIIGLDNGRIIANMPDSANMIASPITWPNATASLLGNRLAVVGLGNSLLWILRQDGSIERSSLLRAPELADDGQVVPPGVTRRRILDIASDERGKLYCAGSPYRAADGGIILQFNADGVLERRFRIQLPITSKDAQEPADGRLLVSHIAVARGVLFVSGMSDSKCAYYRLP